VEARDSGAFSLKADGKYLSAEANGRVTLSRAEAKAWEMFRIEPAGDEPLRIAAFTMVYNDVFLPMWLDYYGREFGRENLYVIDHGSTDGSVEDGVGYNVLRVPRSGGLDEEQRAAFNSDFQSALLKFYDVVVFADADEILIADPARFDGLSDFIARRCESYVTAIGLEVIHAQESEAPLDGSKPVLQQRAHVQFAAEYCKTLVARVPLTWGAGCHSTQRSAQIDRDLYLFHLKRMDHDLAVQNHRKARALRWSQSAVRKHHGIQTRISEEEFIAKVVRPGVHAIAAASDHFDFGKDIKRVPTGSAAATIFRGSVSRIPERFRAVDLRLTPRG
jgi:hypothetical protein